MPKARVGDGVFRTLKYSPWRPKVTVSTNIARLASLLLPPRQNLSLSPLSSPLARAPRGLESAILTNPSLQFSLHPLCSSAVRQRRQRPMDQFPDGHYVWLRSRVHGTYLHADKEGRGVYLSDRHMSMKSAWAVHLYGDEQRVLLHSAANGRYLSATNSSAFGCRGCRVALRNFDDADDMAIRWQPVRAGFEGPILLRQFAVDGRHGYLRANGRDFPLYNKRVTVDNLYIISTMMEWVVQAIPTSVRIPQLQGPPMIDFSALLLSRVVAANGPGHHANNVSFSFRGRYVFRLREELIRRLGIYPADNLVIYVQAGAIGRPVPLVVNLPRNRHALLITVETPDIGGPRYPDFELPVA